MQEQTGAAVRELPLNELPARDSTDLLALGGDVLPQDLPQVVREHAEGLGFSDLVVYVSDLQQRVLVPFVGIHEQGLDQHAETLGIDGTLAGRSYRSNRLVCAPTESGDTRMWLPMRQAGQRLGVLGATVPSGVADEAVVPDLQRLTLATAHLFTANMRYADALVNLRRRGAMGTAAEIQWGLLPPLGYSDSRVSVAAILEPAYDVAGDSLDYSIENGGVQCGIFDAVGHGLASAQTAELAIASYRNTRRANHSLNDMAELIDQTLERGLGDAMFTTAVLARLDTDTGLFTWLNAGHPAPLLFRQGRFVKSLDTVPLLPLGVWRSFDPEEHRPTPASEQLQPGDQVLLYTDGVVEARTPTGDLFGVERLVDFVRRNFTEGVSAEESIRRIAMSLLEHQEDQLRDDATLLLLEWVDQAASTRGSSQAN